MDILAHNRAAWTKEVESGNKWTLPVCPEEIARARTGDWQIVLTPTRPVPRAWFPALNGADVLCLASGGGQQGPILAAAGANVTVLDNCPAQLARDEEVARREGLSIRTIQGDMANLAGIPSASFDLIVHPVSNVFVPDVLAVWNEAGRVLRPGGVLLSGMVNPLLYIFNLEKEEDERILEVKFPIPYADLTSLPAEALQKRIADGEPLEWSHTLEELIGGQIAAGFVITGFFEDTYPGDVISDYIPTMFATRAVKGQ